MKRNTSKEKKKENKKHPYKKGGKKRIEERKKCKLCEEEDELNFYMDEMCSLCFTWVYGRINRIARQGLREANLLMETKK